MKRFLLAACTLFYFCCNLSAHAGWVSSGGDIYGAEKNPWFLRNTMNVNYCVRVDSAGISIPDHEVRSHIVEAIAYWKNEFSQQNIIPSAPGVGGQTFTEIACADHPDLIFLVGSGTLNKDQRLFIGDLSRHLGIAVRTDYDLVAMRARGFIYLASDQGKEKFGDHSRLPAQPWSQKNMMTAILVHELGHVFGLPHFGTGLMSESLAEKVSLSLFSGLMTSWDHLPSTLKIPEQSQSCQQTKLMLNRLNLNDSSWPNNGRVGYCLKLDHNVHSFSLMAGGMSVVGTWKILGFKESDPTQTTEIGSVVLQPPKEDEPLDMNFSPVGFIFLTPGQNVFQATDLLTVIDPHDINKKITLNYIFGSSLFEVAMPCTVELKDGSKQSAYMQLSSRGHKIVGAIQDGAHLIFSSDDVSMFF